jgi:hypothetical protein
MKKQFLTLTMCLALTATAALAAGTGNITSSVSSKSKIAEIAKTSPKAQSKIMGLTVPSTQDQPKLLSREEARKAFETRKAKERELLYTALELTADQKVKVEAIDAKTRANLDPLFRKLQVEARKLRALRAKKASAFSIWRQKLAVKSAKAGVDKCLIKSKKDFDKKDEIDKFKKQHKSGQKMGPKPPEGTGPNRMGPPPEGMGKNGRNGQEPVGPPPPDDK